MASATYTLDSVGNRTQRVDQQRTHTYAYDNVYRLTSVTYFNAFEPTNTPARNIQNRYLTTRTN